MDNLSNFGVKDDNSRARRTKSRGKRRKLFVIDVRYPKCFVITGWILHSRYINESRRDQAYAALVKKATNDRFWNPEYRTRDE